MATLLSSSTKHRSYPFFSQTMRFQRAEEKTKTKKIQRKIRLRAKHILLFFFFLTAVFFAVQRVYLFLISWESLNIKSVAIVCGHPGIKDDIRQVLQRKKLGNILLFDIRHLQEAFRWHRWVKEVRVSKVFPSTLKIEIKERTPMAVLKKVNFYLVDRDGILLEQVDPEANISLPLLTDSNNFVEGYKEKLESAWKCLDGLSPEEKEQVESLDLTDDRNLALRLRNSPTKLIIGNDQFSKKIKLFQEYQAKLEKLGQLEYADLRFPGRFYVKLNKGSCGESAANFRKEAN